MDFFRKIRLITLVHQREMSVREALRVTPEAEAIALMGISLRFFLP
jgi:hypothetical protein